ncbi:hypothetical protein CPT_Mater235 [Bacillus phage Mater]|uniref:Uncharacterized protein n=1 Tax=Bacillus phage Mater TaxID=1540090 RepID=A0A0A0RM86_9CAUD|nr:hypothetical protein CPT_Mater13 [Bacillus phage Mater]YP_009151194.1 hypothetical protein CPT_Mater235 [Bacillus phage Mater]AIW03170.1 hypothetical protein CPT_Mater13 [Bacillus phage Mater]AIW03392.1 hypothetical protein CPT_Mater235 [Bacillus phage Mater]
MTNKYTATVTFEKTVEKDNWELGCYDGHRLICDDTFSFEFTTAEDLKEVLATWISNRFDVQKENFLNYVQNECYNNRFDYSQSEDAEGEYTFITEDNPDGFLASYMFWVDVTQKVEFEF